MNEKQKSKIKLLLILIACIFFALCLGDYILSEFNIYEHFLGPKEDEKSLEYTEIKDENIKNYDDYITDGEFFDTNKSLLSSVVISEEEEDIREDIPEDNSEEIVEEVDQSELAVSDDNSEKNEFPSTTIANSPTEYGSTYTPHRNYNYMPVGNGNFSSSYGKNSNNAVVNGSSSESFSSLSGSNGINRGGRKVNKDSTGTGISIFRISSANSSSLGSNINAPVDVSEPNINAVDVQIISENQGNSQFVQKSISSSNSLSTSMVDPHSRLLTRETQTNSQSAHSIATSTVTMYDKDNINISGSNNSGDFTNIFSNKVNPGTIMSENKSIQTDGFPNSFKVSVKDYSLSQSTIADRLLEPDKNVKIAHASGRPSDGTRELMPESDRIPTVANAYTDEELRGLTSHVEPATPAPHIGISSDVFTEGIPARREVKGTGTELEPFIQATPAALNNLEPAGNIGEPGNDNGIGRALGNPSDGTRELMPESDRIPTVANAYTDEELSGLTNHVEPATPAPHIGISSDVSTEGIPARREVKGTGTELEPFIQATPEKDINNSADAEYAKLIIALCPYFYGKSEWEKSKKNIIMKSKSVYSTAIVARTLTDKVAEAHFKLCFRNYMVRALVKEIGHQMITTANSIKNPSFYIHDLYMSSTIGAKELEDKGRDVISLANGFPSEETFREVKKLIEKATEIAKKARTFYFNETKIETFNKELEKTYKSACDIWKENQEIVDNKRKIVYCVNVQKWVGNSILPYMLKCKVKDNKELGFAVVTRLVYLKPEEDEKWDGLYTPILFSKKDHGYSSSEKKVAIFLTRATRNINENGKVSLYVFYTFHAVFMNKDVCELQLQKSVPRTSMRRVKDFNSYIDNLRGLMKEKDTDFLSDFMTILIGKSI